MRLFSFAVWQSPQDSGGSARFSLGAPEETCEVPDDLDPLESLRSDVMLELSNRLTAASISHPHLAPFLMDGLDNAVEHLRHLGNAGELHPIQQWLGQDVSFERQPGKKS